jgi:glutathione synthase/RimK-type ligase-like ATP-grasp enzyme
MDKRPLIVFSRQDHTQRKGFDPLLGRIQTATIGDERIPDAPVVYMRAAHRLFDNEGLEALKVEKRLRARGCRVVNSIRNRIIAQRKDLYYPILLRNNILTPFFIAQPVWNEILMCVEDNHLRLPFLYRTLDEAGGRGMFIVGNEPNFNDVRKAMLHRRCMAVQFINSKGGGPYFRKYRATVVGGKVYMWGGSISVHWNTEDVSGAKFPLKDFVDANRSEAAPTQFNGKIEQIGKILNTEIFAVDMVQDHRTHKFYVVDVNPTCMVFTPPPFFPKEVIEHRSGYFKAVVDYLCGVAK